MDLFCPGFAMSSAWERAASFCVETKTLPHGLAQILRCPFPPVCVFVIWKPVIKLSQNQKLNEAQCIISYHKRDHQRVENKQLLEKKGGRISGFYAGFWIIKGMLLSSGKGKYGVMDYVALQVICRIHSN